MENLAALKVNISAANATLLAPLAQKTDGKRNVSKSCCTLSLHVAVTLLSQSLKSQV